MDADDITGVEPVVLEAGLSGTFEEHTSDQQVQFLSGFNFLPCHGSCFTVGVVQGIDWHRLHQRRDDYRAERLAQYKNYTNVIDDVLARYKNLRLFHEGGVVPRRFDLRDCYCVCSIMLRAAEAGK